MIAQERGFTMANSTLTKYFMDQEPIPGLMPDVEYTEIIKALNNRFGNEWTWELVDDTIIEIANGKKIMTTVTLYVPGRVYTGRSLCQATEYAYNHLRALYDASGSFIDKSNSGVNNTPQNNTSIQSNQMSVDQIAAMMAGNGTFVNNKADMINYPSQDGTPAGGVNFDAISEQGHQEIAYTQPSQATVPQPQPTPAPQPVHTGISEAQKQAGWTEEMLTAINNFKQENQITNDEEFSNWVNIWHPGWTKKNIRPENVFEFIEGVKNLGEFEG